jgi:AraC-like DNA-binding protein
LRGEIGRLKAAPTTTAAAPATLAVRGGILTNVLPVERIVFASSLVCLGEFRCSVGDPDFPGGVCSGHTMVFPREVLWIQHAGSERFLADPTRITFYNKGQEYRRFALSRTDRCDWLAFSDDALREVVVDATGSANDERPFRFQCGPSDPRLYLRQRRLFRRLASASGAPALDVEDCALRILHAAVRRAQASSHTGARRQPRDLDERVQHARALLAARVNDPPSLVELAAMVGLSAPYLSRSFHTVTGMTLRAYRTRLRVLQSLEPVADGVDLSRVAHDLGFSSHSHFTYAFRRTFAVAPSGVRAALAASRK